MGDLFPYEKRGRPLGWLFGAMAGGMAFGSTLGVILAPYTGWRMLFLGVAAASVIVFVMLLRYAEFLSPRAQAPSLTLRGVFQGYRSLIANARGARTYFYVFLNSLFHSGVYTWLGVYFVRRYHLGEVGIGLALLALWRSRIYPRSGDRTLGGPLGSSLARASRSCYCCTLSGALDQSHSSPDGGIGRDSAFAWL